MTKYRVVLALLAGAGFASLIILLLNVPLSPVAVTATILLLPGGIIVTAFSPSIGFGPPLAVLGANGLFYSAIAYVVVGGWFRSAEIRRAKSVIVFVSVPALALACLACLPSLNPLRPYGMVQLSDEERILRQGLAVGSSLQQARAFLATRAVKTYDEEISIEGVVLQRGNRTIIGHPGDLLVSAQIPTQAGEFPCWYRIDMVLVFDRADILKESYIDRFRLCP